MAGTELATQASKALAGVATVGASIIVLPEAVVASLVIGGAVVIGVSAIMLVGYLTGYGVSATATKNGMGFNIGPGTQGQAKA